MTPTIDIWVDFTTQDDTGLPWTLLSEAADPARIVAGTFVVGGNPEAQAVVEIVDVGSDGVVHVRPLPGSVARNAHLLSGRVS
ncbi:MAG TPA: hypothetical protein VG034_26255 [Acidimicrobiia bacterium]|jgi:hypothetical protein|nr:hypothetical protein [Acidimicrobiia bacterium]